MTAVFFGMVAAAVASRLVSIPSTSTYSALALICLRTCVRSGARQATTERT